MLMYSASHVLDAVLPCFFDLQDNGHDRVPQEDRTSSHTPDVDFAVSVSPARSASGDMTTRASSASVIERLPVSIKSALWWQYCMRRFRARSWLVFQLVTLAASRVMATVRSGRHTRAA